MKTTKNLLVFVLIVAFIFACSSKQSSSIINTESSLTQKVEISTPEQALEELKNGNQRFLADKLINTNFDQQIEATKEHQKPHSLILTCMDSRVPPEIILDQGIGSIFVVRNAGNVQDEIVLGSMEYAVKFAGSKLIVVMGHSHCGAVTGAVKNVESGNLTAIMEKIKPCIPADREIENLVDETARINVQHTINEILENSETIRGLCNEGLIDIVAAFYNIETGEVVFGI
jgi:carbonic anhydrase